MSDEKPKCLMVQENQKPGSQAAEKGGTGLEVNLAAVPAEEPPARSPSVTAATRDDGLADPVVA